MDRSDPSCLRRGNNASPLSKQFFLGRSLERLGSGPPSNVVILEYHLGCWTIPGRQTVQHFNIENREYMGILHLIQDGYIYVSERLRCTWMQMHTWHKYVPHSAYQSKLSISAHLRERKITSAKVPGVYTKSMKAWSCKILHQKFDAQNPNNKQGVGFAFYLWTLSHRCLKTVLMLWTDCV